MGPINSYLVLKRGQQQPRFGARIDVHCIAAYLGNALP